MSDSVPQMSSELAPQPTPDWQSTYGRPYTLTSIWETFMTRDYACEENRALDAWALQRIKDSDDQHPLSDQEAQQQFSTVTLWSLFSYMVHAMMVSAENAEDDTIRMLEGEAAQFGVDIQNDIFREKIGLNIRLSQDYIRTHQPFSDERHPAHPAYKARLEARLEAEQQDSHQQAPDQHNAPQPAQQHNGHGQPPAVASRSTTEMPMHQHNWRQQAQDQHNACQQTQQSNRRQQPQERRSAREHMHQQNWRERAPVVAGSSTLQTQTPAINRPYGVPPAPPVQAGPSSRPNGVPPAPPAQAGPSSKLNGILLKLSIPANPCIRPNGVPPGLLIHAGPFSRPNGVPPTPLIQVGPSSKPNGVPPTPLVQTGPSSRPNGVPPTPLVQAGPSSRPTGVPPAPPAQAGPSSRSNGVSPATPAQESSSRFRGGFPESWLQPCTHNNLVSEMLQRLSAPTNQPPPNGTGGPPDGKGAPTQVNGGPSQVNGGPSQVNGGPSQVNGGSSSEGPSPEYTHNVLPSPLPSPNGVEGPPQQGEVTPRGTGWPSAIGESSSNTCNEGDSRQHPPETGPSP